MSVRLPLAANEDFDVIILGAGYGALICGAILARKGVKPLLVDAATMIGQPGGSYPYKGYWLDFSGREPPGERDFFLVTNKWDAVAAEAAGVNLNLVGPHDPIMRLHLLPERGIASLSTSDPKSLTKFLSDVVGLSPQEQGEYFAFMKSLALFSAEQCRALRDVPLVEWLQTLDAPQAGKDGFLKFLNVVFPPPHETTSAGRIIENYIQSPMRFYTPDHDSVGGLQGMCEPYADVIRACGGEIWLDAKPSKILLVDNSATGIVALTKEGFIREAKAPHIIYPHPTEHLFDLIDKSHFSPDFVSKAHSTREHQALEMNLQIGLRERPVIRETGQQDLHQGWNRLLEGAPFQKTYAGGWGLPSNASRKQAPEGKALLAASFVGFRPNTYEGVKAGMQHLVDYIFEYYKHLEDLVEWHEYQWFDGAYAMTWAYKVGERSPMEGPVKNLYFMGYTVEGQGAWYEKEAHSALEMVDLLMARKK